MRAAAIQIHLRARIEDALRYSLVPRTILALTYWALARATHSLDRRWLDHACAAARSASSDSLMMAIEEWMQRRLDHIPVEVLWSWMPAEAPEAKVNKTAILKPATADEKGVLFISFESQWEHLTSLGPERLAKLAQEYDLVLAPTWSPPHCVVNLVFPRLYPGLIHCTISNLRDLTILPRLSPRYRPLRLFASSWVHADLYQPRARAERDIDLVMVANFGRYKRHHSVFHALAQMPVSKRPRITLVGQPHGDRTAEVLIREMKAYGVEESFTLRSRISDAEVVDILGRSRAALITSLREGSCVAVVESMMADTPLALLRGAEIGSAAFLNDHTGRWLDEEKLVEQLPRFIAESDQFSPRAWLLENEVECRASTRLLNEHLRAQALAEGRVWTRDIFPHHWRPDPRFLEPEHKVAATAATLALKEKLGLNLG